MIDMANCGNCINNNEVARSGRAQDGNIVNNPDQGSPGENKDEKNIKKLDCGQVDLL
ncbi:hypothetical protein CRD_00503 [Raphidiopsis brookii D9]|nr:hypothetical protein CRD_00503 [Raphidiopsis brookii D9]